MQVFRTLDEIPEGFGPTVVSIGNFDGVHLGHQYVLRHVREHALRVGARSVAVLFDPHPTRLLRPSFALKLITPLPERIALLEKTGIDAVLALPFTPALSHLSAGEFARHILRDSLHAIEVHEGDNFRFGYKAEGGVQELVHLGHDLGFSAHIYPARRIRGCTVSSSAIRELVAAGDVRRARWLLGRPFSIVSKAARGRGVGSRLTAPTINLAEYDELLPGKGVYVTQMFIGGACFQAVTNVGTRPTFADAGFSVETHLLNFRPMDVPEGSPLEVIFLARLREERKWPSPEALKAQIGQDVARAQRYFRLMRQP